MSPVIPVLDLMIGQIVLAQGGDRGAYRPVHSRLTTSSAPLDVAQAIFAQTGCDWLYLADIDSFAGAQPNWNVYRDLLDRGFGLWVDADWISQDRFQQIEVELGSSSRLKIIVSSETLERPEQLGILGSLIEAGLTPIFSLDQKGDAIISRKGELSRYSSLELIQTAYQTGIREFIVLDLEQVGTKNGFSASGNAAMLVQEVASELPDARMTSGGGVRSTADIQRWINVGCQHVLVASAIHDGLLTPDDVTNLGLMRR